MHHINQFRNDERGGILVKVWLTALIFIFSIVTVYITTYDLICVRLYNIALVMAPEGVEGGYFSVLNLLRSIWNVIPWISIFGVLLWAYANSQRTEYEEGYYGPY
jgi:hypothetical protein